MYHRKLILDYIKINLFDGKMSTTQRRAISDIIDYWMIYYVQKDARNLAYILATADYESDRKFTPIEDKEKGKGERYGMMEKKNGESYSNPLQLYYPRGIVPLIWYDNYKIISSKIGVNILDNPQKVMDKDIAIKLLVDGMMLGWYTGYRLEDFLDSDKHQWAEARKVIRKSEKKLLIKSLALKYYSALKINL